MKNATEQVTIKVSVDALELLSKTQTRVQNLLNMEWFNLDVEIKDIESKIEKLVNRKKKKEYRYLVKRKRKQIATIRMDIKRIQELGSIAKDSRKAQFHLASVEG